MLCSNENFKNPDELIHLQRHRYSDTRFTSEQSRSETLCINFYSPNVRYLNKKKSQMSRHFTTRGLRSPAYDPFKILKLNRGLKLKQRRERAPLRNRESRRASPKPCQAADLGSYYEQARCTR